MKQAEFSVQVFEPLVQVGQVDPDAYRFAFMINKMRETEIIREKELGRPFSCVSSKPKYNADYLEKVIKTKWLKKLEELESENAYKNGLQRIA